MVTRQVIGKRRNVAAMQSRGVERRRLLIDATLELLASKSPQEISLRDVAEKSGVPEASAYHFYANKYDLFAAVASEMSALFKAAQSEPIPGPVASWHEISDTVVDRGARVYADNKVARALLIGPETPPEIKQVDRANDRVIARLMLERFADHFTLPGLPELENIFFNYVELTDLMFSLSVREHGDIAPEYVEESKRVGRGYLSVYFPPVLPRRPKI